MLLLFVYHLFGVGLLLQPGGVVEQSRHYAPSTALSFREWLWRMLTALRGQYVGTGASWRR